MKENMKKEMAIGIVLLFLSAGIISAAPINDQKFEKEIEVLQDTEPMESDLEDKIMYSFGVKDNKVGWDSNMLISEVKLSEEESIEMEEKIKEIDNKLKQAKSQEEFLTYLKEKLNILISYGVLPSFFSFENLTKLVYEISNSFNDYKNERPNPLQLPKFLSGMPYVGMGPGVFAYISPLGTTTPKGVWNITYWRAIGIMFQTNVKINHSGIFISGDSPIIKDRNIQINGPIWQSIWKAMDDNGFINYSLMSGYGMYMLEMLIGHTISASIAWSSFPMPMPKVMAGSFYYFGGPTIPLSFTVYKTYPRPWTTILDIGIVFSIMGQIIFPFWIENS